MRRKEIKQQFTQKISTFIENIVRFKMLGLHLDRLSDITLADPETSSSEAALPHTVIHDDVYGKLTLNDISFRYSDVDPYVIKILSLVVEPGESIAVIGPSGCGKSTLMKIMLGLLRPQQGEILLDELAIEHRGLNHYRSQIAAILQDDQPLSGSLADNISFFDPKPNENRIIACSRHAGLHRDILQMPMGYNSLIGDMGTTLSGGQQQRLLIARALYAEPKILFMDEATSYLDSELEEHINQTIKRLRITRILIAHRPSTIATADRVFQLVRGQLKEVNYNFSELEAI